MASKEELCSVIDARADLYRSLAGLFFNPLTDQQIEAFAQQVADACALWCDARSDSPSHGGDKVSDAHSAGCNNECPACSGEQGNESSGEKDGVDAAAQEVLSQDALIAEGFNDMYRYLRRRHTGTRQELAMDFTQCFLGARTYKGMTAAPYETLYRDPSGMLMGPIRHEVFSLYKSECVRLGEGVDYADDHLSFELEFLAILCDRCGKAVMVNNVPEALRILEVQRRFLDEHLLIWFPRFYSLTTKFLETRFYRGALKVTRGFLEEEPAVIDDLVVEVGQLASLA